MVLQQDGRDTLRTHWVWDGGCATRQEEVGPGGGLRGHWWEWNQSLLIPRPTWCQHPKALATQLSLQTQPSAPTSALNTWARRISGGKKKQLLEEEQHEDTAVVSHLKRKCSSAALLCKENGHHLGGRAEIKHIVQTNPALAGR